MLVLQANQEQEATFNRLIQTMGEQVVWNGRFIVVDNELVLEGTVRSLVFQFDTRKVLTNLVDLPVKEDQILDISRHPTLKDLVNMVLYAFGKWGTLRGLKVEQDYPQLNQLFSKILGMYYIEPSFRKENFRFYKVGVRITYEEVLHTVLEYEKKQEDDPKAESQGLWHRLIWKNRERAFHKTETTLLERVEDRIGNNFYLVGYECPKCSQKLHMAVYPEGKEVRIDTEEKGVYLARAYTCSNCFCFYTPRPDRLISEGLIYEMDFSGDEKAYEDYLELLGYYGERAANFKYNEYEAIRKQRLNREEKEAAGGRQHPDRLYSPQDALKQMEDFSKRFSSLPNEVFQRFAHRVEEGFYPDAAVAKHEKKILKEVRKRQEQAENSVRNAGGDPYSEMALDGLGQARQHRAAAGMEQTRSGGAAGSTVQAQPYSAAAGRAAQIRLQSGSMAAGTAAQAEQPHGTAAGETIQAAYRHGTTAGGTTQAHRHSDMELDEYGQAMTGSMELDEYGQARSGGMEPDVHGRAVSIDNTDAAADGLGQPAGISGTAARRDAGGSAHHSGSGQGGALQGSTDGRVQDTRQAAAEQRSAALPDSDPAQERLEKYRIRVGMLERLSDRQKQELKKQIQNDSVVGAADKKELLQQISEAEYKDLAEQLSYKAEKSEKKNYGQMQRMIKEAEEADYPDGLKRPYLEKLRQIQAQKGKEEVEKLMGRLPERMDRAAYQKLEEKLNSYADVDLSPYQETLKQKREAAEKHEIAGMVKRSRKANRGDYIGLMRRLEEQNFADENVAPYMEKIQEKVHDMDEERLDELLNGAQQMDFDAAAAVYEQIDAENFLPELKSSALEMLSKRLEKIRTDECELLVGKLQEEMRGTIKENARHHFYPARKVMLHTAEPAETSAIDAALSAYASERGMFEYPIFSVDTSRSFNGREGMVLTPENLFYSTRLHAYGIPIANIASIEASTGLLNRRLTLEETDGAQHKLPYAVKTGEMEDWATILEEFIHYLQEKPASRKLNYLAKETHDTICCYRCGYVYHGRDICPECGYKKNR